MVENPNRFHHLNLLVAKQNITNDGEYGTKGDSSSLTMIKEGAIYPGRLWIVLLPDKPAQALLHALSSTA